MGVHAGSTRWGITACAFAGSVAEALPLVLMPLVVFCVLSGTTPERRGQMAMGGSGPECDHDGTE